MADLGGGTVGLVLVSHSRALAEAAVRLATEMVQQGTVPIEVAAGLDESTLGTDAVAIKEAIERVDGPAGVVVLMDLGSAVLSAELALDLLDEPDTRDRVTLSAAPVVEGLVVAAVAAAGGADRAEVAAEARDALLAKSGQLGTESPDTATDADTADDTDAAVDEVRGVLTVQNEHGLHARPAARLVAAVRGMDASVRLRNLSTGAGPVPAGSLSRVATLAAVQGHEVEVRATGTQARQAVDRLVALAGRRFDEPAEAVGPRERGDQEERVRRPGGPLGASPGIAVGPARQPSAAPVDLERAAVPGGPEVQWRHLADAVETVRRDIGQVRTRTARTAGGDEAAIFDAHLSLLGDDELLADVRTRIDGGAGAVDAWSESLARVEQQWADLPDPYLRERAQDVRAVADQVLRAMTGEPATSTMPAGVLVARDLTPGETATLDPELVQGIVLAEGSPSAHAAILARARALPMVVAAGPDVLEVPDGTTVALDGGTGELHVDPAPDVAAVFDERARRLAERRADELADAQRPAVSTDGVVVEVLANVGSASDARSARASGADGVGLVRTEFLFLDRSAAPHVDEQQAEYVAIADAMDGRPVTLRTLDVGGDKPLPYLPVPAEANPFLGRRGIRLGLDHRDLLRDQLAAVCSTSRHAPTAVMFPMVSTLAELLEARGVLEESAGPEGVPADLRVGIMVEVPATALRIATFRPHLDFVSIGTNDLTQYALAAERGNSAVAGLTDALDPGVLRLVDHVCREAGDEVDVAVCGEAASDDDAVPVLVGLGVRELSVSPAAVPRVKAVVRSLDVGSCAALAQQTLGLDGPADVRELVRRTLAGQ